MAVTLNDKYLKGVVNADELKGMEPMVKSKSGYRAIKKHALQLAR